MNLRLGTPEDTEKIGILLKDMWLMHVEHEPDFIDKENFVSSSLEKYFENCFNSSNTEFLFVAEVEGNMAGVVKVKIQEIQKFFHQRKVLYIDDIYTVKEHRNQGVASFILIEMEKFAKSKNILWLKARIYAFNEPAQKTFLSADYKNLYSEYFKILK